MIFHPFRRLEEAKNFTVGTGLGLRIVKDIIGAHHGSITVHSRSGGETIFRVEFPTHSQFKTGLSLSAQESYLSKTGI